MDIISLQQNKSMYFQAHRVKLAKCPILKSNPLNGDSLKGMYKSCDEPLQEPIVLTSKYCKVTGT